MTQIDPLSKTDVPPSNKKPELKPQQLKPEPNPQPAGDLNALTDDLVAKGKAFVDSLLALKGFKDVKPAKAKAEQVINFVSVNYKKIFEMETEVKNLRKKYDDALFQLTKSIDQPLDKIKT